MSQKKTAKKGRGVTMAALALALCGAVYLNWSYAQEVPEAVDASQDTVETAASGEAVAVIDPLTGAVDAAAEESGKNYGEAQLVSLNKDTSTEFFEQARLSRTKARDEALDTIKKTLKSSSLSDEEKDALSQQLTAQVNNITVESSLETLIKAKGFADCVVMLEDSKVNVTVMTENDALTAEEVTKIRDVILNKCKGVAAQDITVVEVK